MTKITKSSTLDQENIVTLFFSKETSDDTFQNVYQPILDTGDFKGNFNELFIAYNHDTSSPTKRIFLLGLGDKEKLTIEAVRRVFGVLGSKIRDKNIEYLGLDFTSLEGATATNSFEAALEGLLLGNYRYQTMITSDEKKKKPLTKVFIRSNSNSNSTQSLDEAIAYALPLAESCNLVRELGNLPSNIVTPGYLADQAKKMTELGLKVTILDKEQIEEEKMGLFQAVFKGSADSDPPKFIIMEYKPENYQKTLVLVGKAITFDTGGVSLKPVAGMGTMIADMCGGGAVIGSMKVIGHRKPNIRVIGLVPSTPNVVDGKSYRPGDVITSRAGKTIEVTSTDAEGRMLLADALDYAKNYNPDLVFDFATLTGSIARALGPQYAGYFINDKGQSMKGLAELIYEAGQISGDYLWQMPLNSDYSSYLKSKFADFKQSGGPLGGSITAALLLSKFTDYPWVHFDIAGTAFLNTLPRPANYNAQIGATAFGVRFISQFIREWEKI